MGIRFHCHHCDHPLHVKDFLAGKRGICPECDGRFRIPLEDREKSLPVDVKQLQKIGASANSRPADASVSSPAATHSAPRNSASMYLVRPPSGGTYGPADLLTIESWIAQNRITRDTELAPVGSSNWKEAQEVFPRAF